MGRKSQNTSKNSSKKSKLIKEEKELFETVDNLLKLTTLPIHQNVTQSLECQKQINTYIERIQNLEEKLWKKQQKNKINNNNNEAAEQPRYNTEVISKFTNWLTENGAELNGCTITQFEDYDLGLKVDQDIPQSSLVIAVPRKIMMSVETAKNSLIQDLIEKVEILKNMPNVLLSIYLLVEKYIGNSFWKPYLELLPKSYTTVLYFTIKELEELKGSPTLEVALKQIKSIVRQYAYFHKLFNNSDDAVCNLMKSKFTFNDYCWAVSTIMTRQNMIPSEDGESMINALIPLWDLCNHTNGTISTAYNPNLNRSECLAFKDFKAGQQLFIFYGTRTNADFFIHNGFVYDDNDNDIYWIKLGISKSDALQEKRRELLNKLGIWYTAEFSIKKTQPYIDGRLLAFLRIFNMDLDQLDYWINSEKSADLQYPECALDTALEKKSWNFLKARISLLLASYKTKVEDDEKLLLLKGSTALTGNLKVAIMMRYNEKKLLKNCLEFVEEMIQK